MQLRTTEDREKMIFKLLSFSDFGGDDVVWTKRRDVSHWGDGNMCVDSSNNLYKLNMMTDDWNMNRVSRLRRVVVVDESMRH